MSDQDTKLAEGVSTPAKTPEVDTAALPLAASTAEAQNSDMTGVEAEAEAKPCDESRDNIEGVPQDAPQDTPKPKDQETPDATEADKGNSEGNHKDAANENAISINNPPEGMLKVNRQGCDTRQRSDASVLAESDDPKAIRKQVEFYFSDSNLPEDDFLWNKVDGTNNKPVPLSLICNFSRMRRFKPYSAVVKALKDSKFLVLEGAEDEEMIRRKFPYKPIEDKRVQVDERSTYTKGFGEEQASTQFDIEAFFAQFGEFNSVRLRRVDNIDKTFKGSVFVEWADKETAEKFIALDPKPTWNSYPLMIMWKRDYMKQKTQAIRDGKIEMSGSWNRYERPQRGNRGGRPGRGRGNHRGSDANDWKKRREEDQRTGFNDRRGGRGQRGRGRGRGGPRGQGGDRAKNANDSIKEENGSDSRDVGRPTIHTSKQGEKILKEKRADGNPEAQTGGKRARDEDVASGAPPAKKVDSKDAVNDA
ncbi:hypothetical protein AAE478_001008 [Parahypoxylon ruwenzoriense]